MKKRLTFLLILLAVLFVFGIPAVLTVRELHQEQLNQTLVAAIKANDMEGALEALKVGADANAKDYGDKPPTFRDSLNRLGARLFHRKTRPQFQPTALALLYQTRFPVLNSFSKGEYKIDRPSENIAVLTALL